MDSILRWLEIETWKTVCKLVLYTNKKSQTGFWLLPKLVTLNNLENLFLSFHCKWFVNSMWTISVVAELLVHACNDFFLQLKWYAKISYSYSQIYSAAPISLAHPGISCIVFLTLLASYLFEVFSFILTYQQTKISTCKLSDIVLQFVYILTYMLWNNLPLTPSREVPSRNMTLWQSTV